MADQLLPDDALGGAVASVFDAPQDAVTQAEAPVPFGRSWAFDWERGRFVRAGSAPREVRGLDALRQLLEMARRTARGAHDVFSPDFGMDGPEDWEGTVDVNEAAADYGTRLEDAWLASHERVTAVENYSAFFDPATQAIFVESVDVITDLEDEGAPAVNLAGPAPVFPE